MEDAVTLHGFSHIHESSPYPLLLIGDAGMGKRTWCLQAAKHHDASSVVVFSSFMAADVQRLEDLTITQATVTVVIDLTNVTPRIQTHLAQIIDRAPTVKFFLHADTPTEVVGFLRSRCAVHRVTALSSATVYRVCVAHGMEHEQATLCTALSEGNPARALSALSLVRATHLTRQALSVVRDDSTAELDAYCARATQADLAVLRRAVYEVETGKYTLWVEDQLRPLATMLPQVKYVLNAEHVVVPAVAFSAIMYTIRLGVK